MPRLCATHSPVIALSYILGSYVRQFRDALWLPDLDRLCASAGDATRDRWRLAVDAAMGTAVCPVDQSHASPLRHAVGGTRPLLSG